MGESKRRQQKTETKQKEKKGALLTERISRNLTRESPWPMDAFLDSVGEIKWSSVIMGTTGDGDECDDDAACSANGRCTDQGTCQCTVTWAGRNCTDQNHLYFHSFSLVFYALMTSAWSSWCCVYVLNIFARRRSPCLRRVASLSKSFYTASPRLRVCGEGCSSR